MINKKGKDNQLKIEDFNIDKIIKYIQNDINRTLKSGIEDIGLSVEDKRKRENRRELLNKSLKNSGVGDIGAREYVKEYIQDALTQRYGINEDNIDNIINFDEPKSIQDKFDIILQIYKEKYNYDALSKVIKKYSLDELRDFEGEKKFCVSSKDIDEIYKLEKKELEYETKLEIVTQRIYQNYKGLGAIDEIRHMSINGLSIGVSGIPESFLASIDINESMISEDIDKLPKSYDSVWVNYEGKEIYFEFLTLGSYEELERICKVSYKFNNPPQLSESNPVGFNTTADNCRVSVFRPPFAETWVLIIRKFNKKSKLINLVEGENSDKIIDLNKFLVRGEQTIAITGDQNAGKTTYLKALIEKINPVYAIRNSESFFEMHLRNIMLKRNTMSIQEVEALSRDEALAALKKSTGTVTVIGEVAEDEDVKHISKVARVASKFTLFTHHGKDTDDLIRALRNSLLTACNFNSETIAEEDIVTMLDFNIHLRLTADGRRYVERITEIIPIERSEYSKGWENEKDISKKIDLFMNTVVEFFERVTNTKKYKAVNILEYNIDTEKYEFKNNISKKRRKAMERLMLKEDRKDFRQFCDEIDGLIYKDNEV